MSILINAQSASLLPFISTHLKWKWLLFSCVQLLVTAWTVSPQAPLPMGFFRQEHWSGLPFPSPKDLPDQGVEPGLLHWSGFLTTEPPLMTNERKLKCKLNTKGHISATEPKCIVFQSFLNPHSVHFRDAHRVWWLWISSITLRIYRESTLWLG